MSDLKVWLEGLGLGRYVEAIAGHDVDLSVVPDLTEEDLEKIGLSLGHRRKFLAAAAKLPTEAASLVEPMGNPPPDPRSPTERRQVTVVFVDVVESTALSAELDPEDLLRLLRRYREKCVAVIEKYEGFVAQYFGDGMLVYFGFPQAQEHAAERAVRAALEIVKAVSQIKRPDKLSLQCRIGIATGMVVSTESSVGTHGEETVVGDAPNLAARLQSLAKPGCVLVGATTHQLTRYFFDFAFVGEHAIKGFRQPSAVWQVMREAATVSRFAGAHSTAPIVERERELAFLHDAWRRATQGNGHVVLVVGDAGMGKSRLLEGLAEQISEPHNLLRCQCSPYHRNSVLFPFKTLLRNRLDLGHDPAGQNHFECISRITSRIGYETQTSAALLAEFLEVPFETPFEIDLTPSQRMEETFAIIENFLMAPLDGPVLLLVEDAHWSDQSTQSLITRLLGRIDQEKALVLITYRPELKTNWAEHRQATQIKCKPIGPQHCATLIRALAEETPVDDAIVQQIVARSDGVPLFVTELTKAVVDLGSFDAGKVPLTLKDSLTARLDRLGHAKDIAQVASVIGRQFSYAPLYAVAGMTEIDLRAALARLCESGLVFETRDENTDSYSFNHSLVQEAAYESLARDRRQYLHLEIAQHLEATGEIEATLIAYHYGFAGLGEKSSRFWLLAADRAGDRLAFAESIANLQSALAEAERVADPGVRAALKVDAQLKLGTTLAIHKGPQSTEVESALELARVLAQEANAGQQLFQATWGLYLNAARNRQFDKAGGLGAELLAISRELPDEYKYEALHHRWGFAYFTGQTAKALEFTAEGIESYDRERHHQLSYPFAGHDPGVCAYCVRALMLGLAGRAQSVRPHLDQARVLAYSLQHPLTMVFSAAVGCFALHTIRDAEGCAQCATELVQLSGKYDLEATRIVGAFMMGAAEALKDDVTSGLKSMEPMFEGTLAYGFFGTLPGVILADALIKANRSEEALSLLKRLLDGEAGIFTPELWRMRGELLRRRSGTNADEVERFLARAMRVASEQGAELYRLRAATSVLVGNQTRT